MASVCFRFVGLAKVYRSKPRTIDKLGQRTGGFLALVSGLVKESHESVSFRLQKLEHSADAYV